MQFVTSDPYAQYADSSNVSSSTTVTDPYADETLDSQSSSTASYVQWKAAATTPRHEPTNTYRPFITRNTEPASATQPLTGSIMVGDAATVSPPPYQLSNPSYTSNYPDPRVTEIQETAAQQARIQMLRQQVQLLEGLIRLNNINIQTQQQMNSSSSMPPPLYMQQQPFVPQIPPMSSPVSAASQISFLSSPPSVSHVASLQDDVAAALQQEQKLTQLSIGQGIPQQMNSNPDYILDQLSYRVSKMAISKRTVNTTGTAGHSQLIDRQSLQALISRTVRVHAVMGLLTASDASVQTQVLTASLITSLGDDLIESLCSFLDDPVSVIINEINRVCYRFLSTHDQRQTHSVAGIAPTTTTTAIGSSASLFHPSTSSTVQNLQEELHALRAENKANILAQQKYRQQQEEHEKERKKQEEEKEKKDKGARKKKMALNAALSVAKIGLKFVPIPFNPF